MQPHQDMNQYIQFVSEQYDRAIIGIFNELRLDRELCDTIFHEVSRTGYNISVDFVDFNLYIQPFNQENIQNVIVAVAQFAIYAEASKYQVYIQELQNAYNWVNSKFPEVSAYVNQKRAPYGGARDNWNTGVPTHTASTPGYHSGHPAISRNDIHVNNGTYRSPPPNTHGTVGGYSYREPSAGMTIRELNQRITASSLAVTASGANMEKTNHIQNTEAFNVSSAKTNYPAGFISPEAPVQPPPEKPTKTLLVDKRGEGQVTTLEGDDVDRFNDTIIQLSRVIGYITTSKNPVLAITYDDNFLPIPANSNVNEFKVDFTNIESADTIEDALERLNAFKLKHGAVSTVSKISSILTKTILTALKYRYGITGLNGFPYITQHEKCRKYLSERGIDKDINLIALAKLKEIFGDVDTNGFGDNLVLEFITKTETIVLPFIGVYQHEDKKLLAYGSTDGNVLDDLYEQAFSLVSATTTHLLVYDASLTKYHVYKNGSNINTPSNYTVILVD